MDSTSTGAAVSASASGTAVVGSSLTLQSTRPSMSIPTHPPPPPSSEHIRVCIRVRPFDRREKLAHEQLGWKFDLTHHTMTRSHATIKNLKHPPQMVFPCGTLFDETTKTEQLYEKQVADIVESSMCGVNGTIFAVRQHKKRRDNRRKEFIRMNKNGSVF